jgi:hypothetical protein
MASNVPKKNRTNQIDALQKLIDGLTKHAQAIPQLVIGGTTMTTNDVIAKLQARETQAKTVSTSRATWQSAVAADQTAAAQTKTFLSGLRQTILAAFAGQVDTLADFGLTGRKPAVVSPETRVVAAQKAKATREARHTMGKVQKAAITGVVSPPATAAPAPTPAPAAAPTAAPAPVAVTPPPPAPTPHT